MRKYRSWIAAIIITLAAVLVLTNLGPEEKVLGINVRIVYLHGAWVWTALLVFVAAALVGISGLISGLETLHIWSRALGRTGLLLWITYLPLSLWAMQTNWNGLFLAEPRWRLAVVFSLGGLLLQIGITLLGKPVWASIGNSIFLLLLGFALFNTEDVMHPASPILDSDALRIQVYFFGLLFMTILMAVSIAGLWQRIDSDPGEELS